MECEETSLLNLRYDCKRTNNATEKEASLEGENTTFALI